MNADRLNEIREAMREYADAKGFLGYMDALAEERDKAVAALDAAEQERDEAKREVEELGQRMYEETVPKNEANERIAHEQEQMRKLCNDQRAEDLARAEAAEKERDEALAAGMDTAQTLTRTAIERDQWQELATRLAEEAGVDAEQMLAQARAEAKP